MIRSPTAVDTAWRATARPGASWWALVKLIYFGRVWYSESIPVTVIPPA